VGREHAPSQARAIAQAAKRGEDLKALAKKARDIDDPYHAAWALFHLTQDSPRYAQLALDRFDQVDQSWRRAELAAEVAPRLDRDGETAFTLARRVILLPAGKARSQALTRLAKRVPPDRLPELLAAAVQDPETATDDAKAILRAWVQDPAGDMETPISQSDPDTRARLYGYLNLQAAKDKKSLIPDALTKALQAITENPDPENRVSHLRYLATVCQTMQELQTVLDHEAANDDRVRLLQKAIAQADRFGEKEHALRLLEEARSLSKDIEDETTKEKAQANLDQAEARLTGTPTKSGPQGKDAPREKSEILPQKGDKRQDPPPIPLPPAPRSIIALHNGYTGDLATAHKRVIARAAPLCAAFGLDLMLIGFPAEDEKALTQAVEQDTRIGEGAGYLRLLLEQGRIHFVQPQHHADPSKWNTPGNIIATTPHPAPGKQVPLEKVAERPILVVGVGPQGLPARLLQQAPHHLELTGHQVSLETATALGVIAERLRTWRPPGHRASKPKKHGKPRLSPGPARAGASRRAHRRRPRDPKEAKRR
jgi:uncharacterized protein